MVSRKVCCRAGASRAPPRSSFNRFPRRSTSACGENRPSRAVASSIASGKPSNRTQSSATARPFSSVSRKSGLTARARSTNSSMASHCDNCPTETCPRSVWGSSSGGTGKTCSPLTCSASRLVTRYFSSGQSRSSSAIVGAAAITCSKLSRRSSIFRVPICASRSSRSGRLLSSRTPRTRAVTDSTDSTSRLAARSTK